MKRITGFDYLRIMAVFAVVWIHGSDTDRLADRLQLVTSFAVPCFVLMSAYLFQASLLRMSEINALSIIRKKVVRLIPAYLVWSVVYIVVRLIKHHLITKQPMDLDWLLLFGCGGSSYQLWFVPSLVIWTICFVFVAQWACRYDNNSRAGTGLVLAGVILWVCGHYFGRYLTPPHGYELFVSSTIHYFGYFPIGMGAALLMAQAGTVRFMQRFSRPQVAAFSCFVLFWQVASVDIPSISLSKPLYSLLLFMLFLSYDFPAAKGWVKTLATYSFGIYLCHAFFVEGLQMLLPALGIGLNHFGTTLLVIVLAFSLGALLCLVLGRMKVTRWLVT